MFTLQIAEVGNVYLTPVLLQGMGESVRHCLLKFALSFLVVAESDVISAILELKGETHNDILMIAWKALENSCAYM